MQRNNTELLEEVEPTPSISAEKANEENETNEENEGLDSGEVIEDLLSVLDQATASADGSFSCGGALDSSFGLPGLEILASETREFKTMGVPIMGEEQASELISQCSKAPYGKGEETLVDDAVRKSWQLNPDRFRLGNPMWDSMVEELLDNEVRNGLGIVEDTPIGFTLYKLLLYEEGGHFEFHTDTEKEDKMFATLVVQLPSVYTGGEIIVKHGDKEETYDFSQKAAYTPFFVTFYSDCQHRVCPVRSGYRLCLVYNVIYTGISEKPFHVDNTALVKSMSTISSSWSRCPEVPLIVYLLEYKYSRAGLRFDCLKGADANKYHLLKQCNDMELYLGIMKKKETGCPTGDDEDEFEELENTEYIITHAVDKNNKTVSNLYLTLLETDIVPYGKVDTLELDGAEKKHSGPTGNEGATLEKWYMNACFILLPKRFKNFTALRKSPEEAVATMEEMLKQYRLDNNEDTRTDCVSFAIGLFDILSYYSSRFVKYAIELNDLYLCTVIIDKSEYDIIGQDLLDLVNHFGLDSIKENIQRKISKAVIGKSDIGTMLSFVDKLGDASVVASLFKSAAKRNNISVEYISSILDLQSKYNCKLRKSLKEVIISSLDCECKPETIKSIFSVAQIMNEAKGYELVLKSAWATRTYYGSKNPQTLNEPCELKAQVIVDCIDVLGLELCSASLNSYIERYVGANVKRAVDAMCLFNLLPQSEISRHVEKTLAHCIIKFGENNKLLIDTIAKLMVQLYECGLFEELTSLAQYILSNPSKFDMIAVMAIVKDVGSNACHKSAGVQLLIQHCLDWLSGVMKKSQIIPSGHNNWTLPTARLSCTCAQCQDVQMFFSSPTDKTYSLTAKESIRKHVGYSLQNVTEDIDLTTETGRTYTLKITKTRRSTEMQKRGLEINRDTVKFLQSLLLPITIDISEDDLSPPTKKVKNDY